MPTSIQLPSLPDPPATGKSAPYVAIVAPGVLKAVSMVAPISVGNHTTMLVIPLVISKEPMSAITERHEAIHVWQMIECSVVGLAIAAMMAFVSPVAGLALAVLSVIPYGFVFWVTYLGSFLFNWFILRVSAAEAYFEVIFEREAYAHAKEPEYIKGRQWFAWLRRRDVW